MNTPIYDELAMEHFRKQLDQLPSVQVDPPRRWNPLTTAGVLLAPCLAFWGLTAWAVIQ